LNAPEPPSEATVTPNWAKVGLPRWYDDQLGKMGDKKLAAIAGVTPSKIRHRRKLFGIPRWTVAMAIAPHAALLGEYSDSYVARLCNVSSWSVRAYREAAGIALKQKPEAAPCIPPNHPVKPYASLLGLIEDKVLAALAGVSTRRVVELRETLRLEPPPSPPRARRKRLVSDYFGPLLGYESLLGVISDAKVSRATGLPISVIESRRRFLGIEPYQRISRIVQYDYLLAIKSIPSAVLAELVGLSASRISEIRRKNEL
jgi:hypothetical protein